MAHRIAVTLSDGMYQAARTEAAKQGRADGRTDGVASLMRGALRAHLSRNGWKAGELDRRDRDPLPAGRKPIETEAGQDLVSEEKE